MLVYPQGTFTPLVHAHVGRTKWFQGTPPSAAPLNQALCAKVNIYIHAFVQNSDNLYSILTGWSEKYYMASLRKFQVAFPDFITGFYRARVVQIIDEKCRQTALNKGSFALCPSVSL